MIHDLVSNHVLTHALTPRVINASAAGSEAIDLSEGTTGCIQLSMSSAGAAIVDLALEHSDDNITWAVDDGTTGNGFFNSDNEAYSPDPDGNAAGANVELNSGAVLIFAVVANPRGTAQYARIVMVETATVDCIVSGIGAVGPKRLSVPKDA